MQNQCEQNLFKNNIGSNAIDDQTSPSTKIFFELPTIPTGTSVKAESLKLTSKSKDFCSPGKFIFKKELRELAKKRSSRISCSKTHLKKYQIMLMKNYQDKERILSEQPSKKLKKVKSAIDTKFKQFLQARSDDTTCPVCNMHMFEPVTTPCGHLFCLQCIEQSMVTLNRCPMCRQTIADEQNYNLGFSNGAQNICSRLKHKLNYGVLEQMQKQYLSWKKQRFITAKQIMSTFFFKLDLYTHELEWKSGTVIQKYLNKNSELSEIKVQYYGIHGIQSQIIPVNSLRLARNMFYSQKQNKFETFDNFSIRMTQPTSSIVTEERPIPSSNLLLFNALQFQEGQVPHINNMNNIPFPMEVDNNENESYLFRPPDSFQSIDPEPLGILRVDSIICSDSEDEAQMKNQNSQQGVIKQQTPLLQTQQSLFDKPDPRSNPQQ